MYAGLAVPAALTSPCWLGAAAPGGSSSTSEDSAEDMSDTASDFEELYSEGDDVEAEIKKLQVC